MVYLYSQNQDEVAEWKRPGETESARDSLTPIAARHIEWTNRTMRLPASI